MILRNLGAIGFLVAAFVGPSAAAQMTNAGDQDPSGRVYAKVVVTMTGESGSFGHPGSGVIFLVVTESGDRVSMRTNDAGVASTWLFPGSYRFVTPDPFAYEGNAYTWDAVVVIRPGTGVIRLSQANASKVAALTPTSTRGVAGIPQNQQRVVQQSSPGQIPFQYKDGTTATLWSLLITGGGQLYSGETGKGLTMLLSVPVAIVVGYAASNCDAYSCQNDGPLVAGYLFAVGMYVYSLVDAHSAAARHNALAPQSAVRPSVEPVLTTGAERTTKMGVSLRF